MWQLVMFFVGVSAPADSLYGVLVFRRNRHVLGRRTVQAHILNVTLKKSKYYHMLNKLNIFYILEVL
jgi:hypothetical protein